MVLLLTTIERLTYNFSSRNFRVNEETSQLTSLGNTIDATKACLIMKSKRNFIKSSQNRESLTRRRASHEEITFLFHLNIRRRSFRRRKLEIETNRKLFVWTWCMLFHFEPHNGAKDLSRRDENRQFINS